MAKAILAPWTKGIRGSVGSVVLRVSQQNGRPFRMAVSDYFKGNDQLLWK